MIFILKQKNHVFWRVAIVGLLEMKNTIINVLNNTADLSDHLASSSSASLVGQDKHKQQEQKSPE